MQSAIRDKEIGDAQLFLQFSDGRKAALLQPVDRFGVRLEATDIITSNTPAETWMEAADTPAYPVTHGGKCNMT